MVTLSEATKNYQESEKSYTQATKNLQQQQQSISKIQLPARDLKFQTQVIQKDPRAWLGVIGQRKSEIRQKRDKETQRIKKEKEKLEKYKRDVLDVQKESIRKAEAYENVRKAIQSSIMRSASKGGYFSSSDISRIRKAARYGNLSKEEEEKFVQTYKDAIKSAYPDKLIESKLITKSILTPETIGGITSTSLIGDKWSSFKEGYSSLQSSISERIPTLDRLKQFKQEKIIPLQTKIIESTPFLDRLRAIDKGSQSESSKKQDVVAGAYVSGLYEGVQEKPLTTGATAVAFSFLPGISSGVGTGLSKIGQVTRISRIPGIDKVAKYGGKGVGLGISGLYGSSIYTRVVSAGDTKEERIKKLGKISSTEVVPMFVGGYVGAKVTPKVSDWWRTRGRTEIPTSQLVPQDVLSGKRNFPLAPTSQHKSLFETQSYRLPITKLEGYTGKGTQVYDYSKIPVKLPGVAYHSTPKQWWSGMKFEVTQPGTSEFQGIYGSHGVSPHFLKVTSDVKLYGGTILNPYGKPSSIGIIPKRFKVGKSSKPGTPFIPKIKREVEAVFPVGTQGEKISSQFYYKWKGRRIPLDIYKTTKPKGAGNLLGKGKSVNYIYSSRGLQGSSYILTPGSFLAGSLIGRGDKIVTPSKSSSVTTTRKPTRIIPSRVISTSSTSNYRPSKSSYKYGRDIINTDRPSLITPYRPSITRPPKTPRYPRYPRYPPYRPPRRSPPKAPPIILRRKPQRKITPTRSIFSLPSMQTRYNPSFTATQLGITSTRKPGKIAGGEFFGIRPMIVPPKKRKKKVVRRRKKKN